MSEQPARGVRQINRGMEELDEGPAVPGVEHEALEIWVGRWINRGHIVHDDGSPGPTITTSDVYEWAPGGFFVLHTAFGRVGDFGGGAIEIIGWDEAAGCYRSDLYDSQGNVVLSSLEARGDTWTYRGETTRATVVFSDDFHVQTVLHERTDDGGATWKVTMQVELLKID